MVANTPTKAERAAVIFLEVTVHHESDRREIGRSSQEDHRRDQITESTVDVVGEKLSSEEVLTILAGCDHGSPVNLREAVELLYGRCSLQAERAAHPQAF